MGFNFLEYFYTDEYDDEIIIKNFDKNFSILKIKDLVLSEIEYLKTITSKDIVLSTEDYFSFIILFLACIFAKKNIFISNNNNKAQNINKIVLNSLHILNYSSKTFPKIQIKDISIYFYTSGTTKEAEIIEKSLENLLNESKDLIKEFPYLKENKYEFITTAPINHLFAITFYLFLSLNSKNIINTQRINYPENLVIDNSILVTSPSFLSHLEKHQIEPKINPKVIISAGARLKEETHHYFEKKSKIINIFGSTETGIMGYKTNSKDEDFSLFEGIKILSKKEVLSSYAKPNKVILNDNIIQTSERKFNLQGRMERIFKIQEKRISIEQLEEEILKNDFIKDIRLVDLEDKLGAMAALSEKGFEFVLKNGILELIKTLKTELLKTFNIIPQKWKFIDEIPINSLGKIDTNKIKELFSLNLSMPLILKRKIENNSAEFDLYFYKNCNFFKGHFDDFPIVPGVVQLYWASFFSKMAFNKECFIGQIKRIKYANIIHPNTIAKLKLDLQEKSVNFEYLDNEKLFSSGCLPLENIFGRVNE